MKIIHVPNTVLHAPVKKVVLKPDRSSGQTDTESKSIIDRRTQTIIRDMILTLDAARDPEGVGLAANQVGLSLAIFIMKAHATKDPTVCINPEILEIEGKPQNEVTNNSESESTQKKEESLEGCLSIPKIWGPVTRAKRIHLEYTDEKGKHVKKWFEGFEAIIVQHEMDHLNGVLFTQRVLEQKGRLLRENSDGEYVPYEI